MQIVLNLGVLYGFQVLSQFIFLYFYLFIYRKKN